MKKTKKPSLLPPECIEGAEVRTFKAKTGGFVAFIEGDSTLGKGISPDAAIYDLSNQIVTYNFHKPYFEKYKVLRPKKSNP